MQVIKTDNKDIFGEKELNKRKWIKIYIFI